MKWFYELIYRSSFIPISWVFGTHTELVKLVESGRIAPCRAIDLGCGTGRDAIYLARQGFEVTGVDFIPAAIKTAHQKAQAAGVEVTFIQDDLTNLRHVTGTFELLLDFGALNDLNQKDRDSYVLNVLPLTQPGSRYLLFGFEKSFKSGEVERRFGEHFSIETIARKSSKGIFSPGYAYHLMTRKEENP